MQALPEYQQELLQLLSENPLLLPGRMDMRASNRMFGYLVSDLGPSVTAYICLEEKSQLTIVAKQVDAVAFEEKLRVGYGAR